MIETSTIKQQRTPFIRHMKQAVLTPYVLFAILSMVAHSQTIQLTDWSTLSSMRNIRAVDVDRHGTIWAATSGGVFAYSGDTSQTKEYRNINALQSLDTRVLACIRDGVAEVTGEVVVGASDGSIDILNADGRWENITDVKRATQYSKRGVTGLLQHESTLFITTEFGLLTFNLTTHLFIETVDRLGTLQEKTSVNGLAIQNDSLWLATDSGLAVVSLKAVSLRLPEEWTIIRPGIVLPKRPIQNIAATPEGICFSADTMLYRISNGNVETLYTTTYPILDLSVSNETLYWSDLGGIGTVNGKMDIPWSGNLEGHSSVVRADKQELLGFVAGSGLDIWDFSTITPVLLNSPVSNKFARMAIDTRGGLWVATDIEPPRSGEGINYFDGTKWLAINQRNYPSLPSNSCYRISALTDGSVMVGTWGRGGIQLRMDAGQLTNTTYTPSNSAVQGISADSAYSLVADAVMDASGTLWMINEQAATQLFVSVNDGSSVGHSNCVDPRSNTFRTIAIDLANNKWAGSTTGSGLVVWNDKGTSDRADDVCNVVRTSNSQLPDNVITALSMDLSGALWIGTPRGLAVISFPSGASNTGIPYVRRISQLSSPVVNDIYVDALNYKWIATATGVFVLNEDGTEVLAEVTRTTAPLLDDNVRSVVVDNKTGTAYFGTSAGCTRVKTSSIEPAPTYDVSVYPQPFRPLEHGQLVVDGLASDSDIRILTTGGTLVQAMQVRGRQAQWDGKDFQGVQVPPGVYLLQVSSASTKQSSVAKIAVQW